MEQETCSHETSAVDENIVTRILEENGFLPGTKCSVTSITEEDGQPIFLVKVPLTDFSGRNQVLADQARIVGNNLEIKVFHYPDRVAKDEYYLRKYLPGLLSYLRNKLCNVLGDHQVRRAITW